MFNNKLAMKLIDGKYGVCRLGSGEGVPRWVDYTKFTSITNTEDELSIVCFEETIPVDVKCERDWKILKVLGPLDFSLVGILSSISTILANAKISIFAISTYDTDYILVKEKDINNAIEKLKENGCIID